MVKSIVPIGTKITFYNLYKKQGEFLCISTDYILGRTNNKKLNK